MFLTREKAQIRGKLIEDTFFCFMSTFPAFTSPTHKMNLVLPLIAILIIPSDYL